MLLNKPSPPHTTVVQFISYQLKFAFIMFKLNKICFIFIVFMVMCCLSQSFRLQTEESLTAVRGRNISIPCNFSVPVVAVYWYKHNFTGAPDDGASVVARDYQGITDPVPGFDRFSITRDYSLIIRNITVHDETTFSCLVVPRAIADERGYTELSVVALADPREPIIQSCSVTAPGRCIYTVDENSPEHVTLSCAVSIVRPPPKLTWIRSDGRVLENTTHQMQEKNGLFNISSQIQVSKADLYKQYTCLADGEAVDGTSSMTSTIEDDVITVYHDRGINRGLITSIVINVILLIILIIMVSYHYQGNNKKYGFAGPLGKPPDIIQSQLLAEQEAPVNLPEPEPLDNLNVQPLMEQEAVNLSEPEPLFDNLEAQPLMEQEAPVNLPEPEPRDHLEAQPLLEQEAVNLSEPEPRDHLEAQPLIEQEAVKLQKPEPLGDIESQPLTDQEEQTATKLSQKIEALENQRKEDRASFEAEKREIESNWQKILHDQVEKLKTQELNETELKQKTEAYENEKWKNRAAFVKERLNTQGNELGMITLIIQYHDSGYIKQSHLKVNQHMQLEELKGKLCAKFRIHQSLIHFAHGGQNLSHGGPEDLTTVGLGNLSVLNVSKIF